MAKEIFKIGKRITQEFNYGNLLKMYDKVQIESKDRQKIFEEIGSKYSKGEAEKINFHIAMFTYVESEKEMFDAMKEKMSTEGLIMSSLSKLAFFDFETSLSRTARNFLMNGHEIGTLSCNNKGPFEKLYPVKKIRRKSNHKISYHEFYRFANGDFNILLREGESLPKVKEIEKMRHENRTFKKTRKYEAPPHMLHFGGF